jgi:hypothetical protein
MMLERFQKVIGELSVAFFNVNLDAISLAHLLLKKIVAVVVAIDCSHVHSREDRRESTQVVSTKTRMRVVRAVGDEIDKLRRGH